MTRAANIVVALAVASAVAQAVAQEAAMEGHVLAGAPREGTYCRGR